MTDLTQTPAVRNSNPGNIKDPATGTFRSFSNPTEGKAALYNDLTAKMTGTSTTGINGNSSILDFAKVYAPASDKNDPVQYAANIANKMGVSPDDKIGTFMPRIDDFASAVASNEDPSATYQQHEPIKTSGYNPTPFTSGAIDYSGLKTPDAPTNQSTGNWLADFGNGVLDPFTSVGAGFQNMVRAGGRALGMDTQAQATAPSAFGGQTDATGYRNGKELNAVDTGTQLLGNLIQGSTNFAIPELRAVEGAGTLAKIGNTAKFGAKIGGAGGFGYGLSQGHDLGQTAMDTGIGAAGGAILGPLAETALGGGKITNAADEALAQKKLVQNVRGELDKLDTGKTAKIVADAKAKGFDVKKNVLDSGVLQNAVDENGTITTVGEEAAHKLYQNQLKETEGVVREALVNEKKTVPLAEIEKKLNSVVDNSNLEGAALTRAKNEVKADIEGYATRADANGNIPLEKVHDFKTNKYDTLNYLNPEAKLAGKTIAKGLKQIVEDNSSNKVKKVNNVLSEHYSTLKYLESLHGKKVEGGRLGKYVAQMLGATIGGHAGPVGAFLGAELANKAKGIMMSGKLGGSKLTGTGIKLAPEVTDLIQANKVARSKVPLQLPPGSIGPKSQNFVPIKVNPNIEKDISKGFPNQSTMYGNRNTIQSTQTNAVKNVIPKDYNVENNKSIGKVAGATALGLGASEASAAVSPDEKSKIDEGANKIFAQSKTISPVINKNYIKALIEQESRSGANDDNRNNDQGKYGWLVGFTKTDWNNIQKSAKSSTKWANLKAKMPADLDTPENAMKAALVWSEYKMRDHTKEQITGKREWKNVTPTELYKLYNGNASPQGVRDFKKIFDNLNK